MAVGNEDEKEAPGVTIEGEPDPVSGTLEEWRAYRRRLAALAPGDANLRVAIAVADAQIARLTRSR